MQEYLVLHADKTFIAAIFYAANNKWFPIHKKDEEFLSLFFYCDPHEDRISYGKTYERHFLNNETNYFGDFFKIISDEKTKFPVRSHNLPAVELLKESGLLDELKTIFYTKSNSSCESEIPTLISFSDNIADAPKKVFIDFLSNNHFRIDSFTIPLSELIAHYYWQANKFEAYTGNEVVLLTAINADLSINLLRLCEGYFIRDNIKKNIWEGRGSDPRKHALVQYVVDCVNKATGFLSTDEERKAEYQRQEQFADDWLRRLDLCGNSPLHIQNISFAVASSNKYAVFVKKSTIEGDTGRFVQEILDIYREFENDFIPDTENVSSVLFFGDSLKNDLVKNRFQTRITDEKIFLLSTNEIFSVLSIYPQIDISRYADESYRLKALAAAEIQKQREQEKQYLEAQEHEQKEKELEEQRNKEEQKKIEADKLIKKADVLRKDKMFTDALILFNQAIELKPNDNYLRNQISELINIIAKIDATLQLYKEIITNADQLFEQKLYDQALIEYNSAKKLNSDNYPQDQINKIKVFIAEQKQKDKEFQNQFDKATKLIEGQNYYEAEKLLVTALMMKPDNDEIKHKLIEVRAFIKKVVDVFEKKKKEADAILEKGELDKAEFVYSQALESMPGDKYCINQLSLINQRKTEIAKSKQVYDNLIDSGSNYYNNLEFEKAKIEFEKALKLFPSEKFPIETIKTIDKKFAEIENSFKDIVFDATILLQKGKQKDALEMFKKAKEIKPDNNEVKERIRKIEFQIAFGNENSPVRIIEEDDVDFFSLKKNVQKEKITPKKGDNDDDFFGKKIIASNDPIITEKEKDNKIDNDDFLNPKRNKNKQESDVLQGKNDMKEDDGWDFLKK